MKSLSVRKRAAVPAKIQVMFNGPVQVKGRSLHLKVTRHPRATRLRMKMDATQVVLTLPMRGDLKHAKAFIKEHEAWIIAHLPPATPALPVPFETHDLLHAGQRVPLHWVVGDRPQMKPQGQGWCITLPAGRGSQWLTFVRQLLTQHWEQTIRKSLGADLGPCVAALGRAPTRVTIRVVKTLWGSLSPTNQVMLDLSLALAPPAVLRYVWIHELCHLRERNHSQAFWHWVAQFCPDWRRHRAWLKEHGNQIKAITHTWLAL